MIKLYRWIILFTVGVLAQENTFRNVAPSLRECYDNRYLLEKDNRLPHTLNTLISILQKIEDADNTDMRRLTVGIMHRFRQDGIVENPTIPKQSGVSPYASDIDQAAKYQQILRLIPEKDSIFSSNILTDIERCTLHFMLSSSIEMYERGDEGTVCRFADNAYRKGRSINSNHSAKEHFNIHDVETLTPEQIDVITNRKNGVTDGTIDPNSLYPELPPNHPEIARVLAYPPSSKCPVENGVVKTKWGAVSIGSVIAGIAAGLQPETVKLSELLQDEAREKPDLSRLELGNKWIATLAGDLAEVTLIQGPTKEKLRVGVNGNWNSSSMPRWYFLNSNEKLEMTTAEIRGGLDGLILANKIEDLYSKVPALRLSQVLDMYYSTRGLFDLSIRACNRGTLSVTVTANSTLSAQTYSAALVLKEYLQKATMDDDVIQRFAVEATNELITYIPPVMEKDSCNKMESEHFNDIVQLSVDLTIILDTTWPFETIQPVLANLLDEMKINKYNSQFMIINGHDGSIMINTTKNILDFGYYNVTHYRNISRGFDFPKSLDKLIDLQTKKLNEERTGFGGANSNIVLIIPYTSVVRTDDKEYCMKELKKIQEQIPDATILISTYGPKETWSDFVNDATNDLFSVSISDSAPSIPGLMSRIRRVPCRLFNTQCGANYSPVGSTISLEGYIEPATVISYRMHPNYFYSSDSSHSSQIKVEGSGGSNLKVCTSRNFININSTESASCTLMNSDTHTTSISCGGASMIRACQPLYLMLIANSSDMSYQCTDKKVCRFPHMIKYTISYENLVCASSASMNLMNAIVLIISVIYSIFITS